MASLTETAYYTRKVLKYGTISLLVFLILRLIFSLSVGYWKKTHPAPPPAPTACFGKIPAIKFPDKGTNPPFYPRLETIENKLPQYANVANVYFMPRQTINLFSQERSRTWAKQLGFSGEPEKTDEYNYFYKTEGLPYTSLKTNIITKNFSLFYDYQNDFTLAGTKNAPGENQAISEAKNFLQKAESLSADLAVGTQKVLFFKFSPPNLERVDPALASVEADFALVNFYRKNLEDLKIVSPDPLKSLVSVLISGSPEKQKRIIEVNFTHFPIDESHVCSYPLKTTDQAWQELKNNQAFLANFGQNYDGQVVIRNIYLAYFDPPEETNYLQPVFVFEGDRDFVAYVPALTNEITE